MKKIDYSTTATRGSAPQDSSRLKLAASPTGPKVGQNISAYSRAENRAHEIPTPVLLLADWQAHIDFFASEKTANDSY